MDAAPDSFYHLGDVPCKRSPLLPRPLPGLVSNTLRSPKSPRLHSVLHYANDNYLTHLWVPCGTPQHTNIIKYGFAPDYLMSI